MANISVFFKKMSAAKFATITKSADTFYRVTGDEGKQDLYLGDQKLNNASDLQDAVGSLTADDIAYGEDTVKDILDTLLGEVSDEGSIAKMINDAITGLTGSATIATVANDVVTIKAGVTESDGEISNNSDADITLAKVAKTGTAADVSVADTSGNLDATNVEAALAEIVGKINDADSDAKVTMDKATGADVTNSANVAEYSLYQGVKASDDATTKAGKLIGKIEISKDMVATSGELVDEDGDGNEGTFIKMIIANGTPFYINVADLIEYNAVQNTTEIILTDTNHTITATVGEIAASKIVYKEAVEADEENGVEAQAKETVAQALNRLDGAAADVDNKITAKINELDATVTQTAGADGVSASVTETHGKLTGVTVSIAANTYDAYGAADGVKTDVIGESTDAKTADTINGAKAFATDAATTAQTNAVSTVVGSNSDAKTADTVNGAKAYADDAVAIALTWVEVED